MLNEHSASLLKYPVIVISLILGFWLLSLLDIHIKVLDIGSGRVELEKSQDAAKVEIQKLAADLKSLQTQFDLLKDGKKWDSRRVAEHEKKLFEGDQVAPNLAAQLVNPTIQKEQSLLFGTKGYIWAGNIDADPKQLLSSTITNAKGYPITKFADLSPNTTYHVANNLILRAQLPPDTALYYRAVASQGVLTKGTKIRLLDKPTLIDRDWTKQAWIHIEIVE